jgi:sphingolipid delta-4 desaturase
LFGIDKNMKWKVTLLVLIQMAMVVVVSELSWKFIFLLAYCFGGVINHALTLGNISEGHTYNA